MADVKRFLVDGTSVGIKDEVARNSVATLSSETEQNFSGVENKISNIKNFSKTILIGDSFLSGTGANNPANDNWGAKLAKYINGELKAFPNGGGGFLTSGAAGTNFTGQISAGGSAYTAFTDRNEVSAVVAVGGCNDGDGSIDTIYNAVVAFVNKAKESFPNAKVYVVYTPTVAPTLPCQQAMGVIQAACDTGAYTPDNSFGWLWDARDSYNSGDNIHPNTAGYARLASILGRWLVSGDTSVPIRTAGYGNGGLTWYFTFDADNLYIRVNGTTTSQLVGNVVSGLAKCLTPANDIQLVSGITALSGATLKGGNIAVGDRIPNESYIFFNCWTIPKINLLPQMFKNH